MSFYQVFLKNKVKFIISGIIFLVVLVGAIWGVYWAISSGAFLSIFAWIKNRRKIDNTKHDAEIAKLDEELNNLDKEIEVLEKDLLKSEENSDTIKNEIKKIKEETDKTPLSDLLEYVKTEVK